MRKLAGRWLALAGALGIAAGAIAATDEHGPAWLNAWRSPRVLAWVRREDARTLARLRADPRFDRRVAQAASVLTDPSTIEEVTFQGDAVYQYHQSRQAPLGVWRRSPRAAWLAGTPRWETVLDVGALAAADHRKYFLAGAGCRKDRCLIRLSTNGRDAALTREFDLKSKAFVSGGFAIPDSKSRAWWYDDETLLVAPALSPGDLNSSLVPKSLRLWRRGTPLADARPLFAIGDHDAMLSAQLIRAAGSDRFVAARHVDFERREYRLMSPDGTGVPLPLPALAQTVGQYRGRLLLRLDAPWRPAGGGETFATGALIAVPLAPLMGEASVAGAALIYQPAPADALRGTTVVGDRLIVELLHGYFSQLVELRPTERGEWSPRALPLPSGRFIGVMGSDHGHLLLREEAPLVPPRIVLADPDSGEERTLYAQAAVFAATGLVSELLHTRSVDGTPIDYLATYRRGMALDGSHPTLVYGYGGYDVPVTPRYEPLFGKLWLEEGGVYVHAYLRGGGEHGPAWHRDAMRERHPSAFDDMAAVLRDLSRRGFASPSRLGIMGRSNGGLMAAAVLERTPELLNAAVIGGPLIDMLDFHRLPPGGTWLAEYGDPDRPEDAAYLRRYSPMQNIAPAGVRYPTPLIITATDDDRVLPGHARRFAWQLAAHGHDRLYWEDDQGGHYWELAGGPIPGDWHLRATARAVEFTYLWQRLGPAGAGR